MDRNFEAEASKEGWVPKEDFKGNPEIWKTAEQFVKDGENILPIVRSKLKKVEETNEELKRSMEKTHQTVEEFRDFHKKSILNAEKRAYDKALSDLKKQQREAVSEGDTERFDRIDTEIKNLQPPDLTPVVPQQTEPAEFKPWKESNQWYGKDNEMTAYAESVSAFIHRNNPGIQPGPFYEKITEEVKKRFSEKFEPPKQSSPVEGGEPHKAKSGGKKYSDLPKEDQKQCDQFVKAGLLTKEDFLRDYWEE